MRPLDCPACGARVFFADLLCAGCGQALVYDPEAQAFDAAAAPCANRAEAECNWAAAPSGRCRACATTSVIPDLSHGDNAAHWAAAERAKRRVFWGLAQWGWFAPSDPGPAPEFHMLSEETASGEARVQMGHLSGTITINVTEADHAERVKRREAFDEPYRTVTGHFRHEIGHFLFERLAQAPGFTDAFRPLFGDERADYGAALARHHSQGAPADWAERHVSAYASAHPHEDWAETFAHVLHLWAILDGFAGEGLMHPAAPDPSRDWYTETDGAAAIHAAGELCLSLNMVNRSMGIADLYPFVLTDPAREKLAFAHRWMRAGPAQTVAAGAPEAAASA